MHLRSKSETKERAFPFLVACLWCRWCTTGTALFCWERTVCESLKIDVFQDIIQLHISCPSDKEEEKSSKDEYENEEKEKKDKAPRKMLSRGTVKLFSLRPV